MGGREVDGERRRRRGEEKRKREEIEQSPAENERESATGTETTQKHSPLPFRGGFADGPVMCRARTGCSGVRRITASR